MNNKWEYHTIAVWMATEWEENAEEETEHHQRTLCKQGQQPAADTLPGSPFTPPQTQLVRQTLSGVVD